ncbi:hypothetical protein [Streptomyces sp. NBC_00063]|uniref:hypothetical protein n=1 Tax=Streptomyces sp. NBC_00063 TaxID=2975638 RepID=UPI003D72E13F
MQAVRLAEETIRRLGEVYGEIDDSDGVVGQGAQAVVDAHMQACRAARADPQRLVAHVLGDASDVTDLDPLGYADVLGPAGLARMRQLAAQALKRSPRGWAEQYLMERLIKAQGDVDALIALYAKDLLPCGATHLRIAEELDAAGRESEALAWAERGLPDTSTQAYVDGRLVDYLCARYTRAHRTAKAVSLRRDRLRAERSLTAYQQLRTAAGVVGGWETEREAALALLREDPRQERGGRRFGGSVLMDALLDDEDLDAAWREAPGGADDRQWQQLADLSRTTRPADALAVYLRMVEQVKEPTGDRAYERMALLLQGARDCHQALDTMGEFTAYVCALRAELKRRRKLMTILDRHGL